MARTKRIRHERYHPKVRHLSRPSGKELLPMTLDDHNALEEFRHWRKEDRRETVKRNLSHFLRKNILTWIFLALVGGYYLSYYLATADVEAELTRANADAQAKLDRMNAIKAENRRMLLGR